MLEISHKNFKYLCYNNYIIKVIILIADKIKNYLKHANKENSIFLDLADEIIRDFPYRLNQKTYLLIPEREKELSEITHEYYFSNTKLMPISLTMKFLLLRDKFENVAKKLGFTVINKMSDYHQDGQLFDLLGKETPEKGLIEDEFIDIPNINKPLTFSVDEYLKNPFFPVVFKNITANRGEDKYLINTKEQLKQIITVLNLPESKKLNLKNEFVAQQYIKSNPDVNSSIRVFASCTGEILSASFIYSPNKTPKKIIKKYGIDIFNPCEYLNEPSSPYYLNTKSIISNAASGGKIIPLNPETANLTAIDEIILSYHEINPETLKLPASISQQVKNIAPYWGTKKGIILGIDFIYNFEDYKWYYLETNRNPSTNGYRKYMNLNNYQKKDVKTLMQLDCLTKIVESIMTKDKEIKNSK